MRRAVLSLPLLALLLYSDRLRPARPAFPDAINSNLTSVYPALPARNEELVAKLKGKVDLTDTLLWWVAGGIDAVNLVAKAVEGGSSSSADIIQYWNSLNKYPGYFGDYTFTPDEHNGYPTDDIVMSAASTACRSPSLATR